MVINYVSPLNVSYTAIHSVCPDVYMRNFLIPTGRTAEWRVMWKILLG